MKLINSILINCFQLIVVSCAFWSCQEDDNIIVDRNYQLVWEDDFSGTAGKAPDAMKWTYDIGVGPGNDG